MVKAFCLFPFLMQATSTNIQ